MFISLSDVLGKNLLLFALALLALVAWYFLPERDFLCVVERQSQNVEQSDRHSTAVCLLIYVVFKRALANSRNICVML